MRVLHQTCAGMDVHKKDVKVCLVTRDSQGQRQEEVRTFRTMTCDLLAMRAVADEERHARARTYRRLWAAAITLSKG